MSSRSAALRAAAAPVWDASLAHPFVRGLGDGTLEEADGAGMEAAFVASSRHELNFWEAAWASSRG